MSSGSLWVWMSSTAVTVTVSPPRTGSRGRAVWPSSRASPDLIQADSREREYSGNRSARTASKRRPALVSGTIAVRRVAGAVMRGRRSGKGGVASGWFRGEGPGLLLSGFRAPRAPRHDLTLHTRPAPAAADRPPRRKRLQVHEGRVQGRRRGREPAR